MTGVTAGDLRVQRTRSGYVAVLRVQGSDGSSVGLVSRCSDSEAAERMPPGVGFSFAKLARGISRAAKGIARSKVFRSFISAAKLLPPPLSNVASVADGAAKALRAMRKGDPAARRAWEAAAAKARAAPKSPMAAGMRLAIQAEGPPRMGGSARLRDLVREVLAELDQQAPEAAPPAPPETATSPEATPAPVAPSA